MKSNDKFYEIYQNPEGEFYLQTRVFDYETKTWSRRSINTGGPASFLTKEEALKHLENYKIKIARIEALPAEKVVHSEVF